MSERPPIVLDYKLKYSSERAVFPVEFVKKCCKEGNRGDCQSVLKGSQNILFESGWIFHPRVQVHDVFFWIVVNEWQYNQIMWIFVVLIEPNVAVCLHQCVDDF